MSLSGTTCACGASVHYGMCNPSRPRRMTTGERKAYSRGYNAGQRNKWPATAPSAIPEPVIRRMQDAILNIRSQVDCWRATIDPDDEWVVAMDAMTAEADAASDAVDEWLTAETENRGAP